MAKHIVRRGKGRPDGRIMHPERDWLVGFLTAVVLFLGGVAYAGFVFYSAWQYDPETLEVDVEAVTYERDLVRSVTETYEAREQAFRELRRDPVPAATTTPETEGGEEEDSTEVGAEDETDESTQTNDEQVELAN